MIVSLEALSIFLNLSYSDILLLLTSCPPVQAGHSAICGFSPSEVQLKIYIPTTLVLYPLKTFPEPESPQYIVNGFF